MKVLLVGIYDTNTVSLAPQILKAYVSQFPICKKFEIITKDFSIFSQTADEIASEINSIAPDIVSFSLYIWNYRIVMDILPQIHAEIIIGGPQITGIENDIITNHPEISIIVTGEGEETFKEILEYHDSERALETIDGITTKTLQNPPRTDLINLDRIPSVYSDILTENKGISWICFETSRGCPNNCRYCTWSFAKKMRYYPLDRVIAELDLLLNAENIREIYFCDSSILLNKNRAIAILTHLVNHSSKKHIRFEFDPMQLTPEIISLMKQLPNNEFNLGIQTVNPDALKEINKKFDIRRFEEIYRLIVKDSDEQKITVDVIYGLPGDNLDGYTNTLDYVLSLPHVDRILTNPLLVLPGSEFFKHREDYGIEVNHNLVIRKTRTFTEDEIRTATKYSFFVNVAYMNRTLRESIKKFSEYRGKRTIDTIIGFLEPTLQAILGDIEYPHMVPASPEDFRHRNEVLKKIIENFDIIIVAFMEYSDHIYDVELSEYRSHFTEHYYKLCEFAGVGMK